MLTIAGGVLPPGVVGDDGHHFGPGTHIAGIIVPIDGFIADGAADRNGLRHIRNTPRRGFTGGKGPGCLYGHIDGINGRSGAVCHAMEHGY